MIHNAQKVCLTNQRFRHSTKTVPLLVSCIMRIFTPLASNCELVIGYEENYKQTHAHY